MIVLFCFYNLFSFLCMEKFCIVKIPQIQNLQKHSKLYNVQAAHLWGIFYALWESHIISPNL